MTEPLITVRAREGFLASMRLEAAGRLGELHNRGLKPDSFSGQMTERYLSPVGGNDFHGRSPATGTWTFEPGLLPK